jgi:hypothetical protein
MHGMAAGVAPAGHVSCVAPSTLTHVPNSVVASLGPHCMLSGRSWACVMTPLTCSERTRKLL